jgi:hypothetical protein
VRHSATSHDNTSDDNTGQEAGQQVSQTDVFELRPPPPVRALAIASVSALAGAVVIVLSAHRAVTVLGALLLGFGVLLAAVALVLTARLRSTVRVDATGLQVSRGRRTDTLAWVDVDQVRERGHQLIAYGREGHTELVVTVPGPRGPSYVRLLDAVRHRLDESRGYRR